MMVIVTWLAFLATAFYAGLIIYYLVSLKPFRNGSGSTEGPKVSVIVPARNEESNIGSCIDGVLSQTYKDFELILVDDCSTDNTLKIMKDYALRDSRVKVISLPFSSNPQKKQAIEAAVRSAVSDIIVTTDADCRYSSNWLATMAGQLNKGYLMIAGPVRIIGTGIFSKLQALDFAGLIGVTASSIEKSAPVMCNGANLVFRRKAFLEAGGYTSNYNTYSGDDMFLMQEIERRFPGKVGFCSDPDAIVDTTSCTSVRSFISQRVRWVTKMNRLNFSAGAIITGTAVIFMNVMVGILAVLSIFSGKFVILFSSILTGKLILDGLFLGVSAQRLKQAHLIWLLPLFEVLYLPYLCAVAIGSMKKKYNWKSREVRI